MLLSYMPVAGFPAQRASQGGGTPAGQPGAGTMFQPPSTRNGHAGYKPDAFRFGDCAASYQKTRQRESASNSVTRNTRAFPVVVFASKRIRISTSVERL